MTISKKQDLANEKFNRIERLDKIFYNDLYRFNRDILGYKDMNEEHRELCSFLMGGKPFKMVLMPRYTFKSCIITVGYSLWSLFRDPNLRILIHSDASTKAEGFLQGIKHQIMGKAPNSNFRKYFPDWETDRTNGKWNESEIIIKPRYKSFSEPTVKTAGIGTALTGFHVDLIIFDDLVSDVNVTTKEQMDKTYEAYKKALSLLKPGGKVLLLGTRWSFGDAYGRIMAENEESKVFDIMIKKAVDGKNFPFADIGLTRDFLKLQKSQQGSYMFSCLYQNSPVDEATATFKVRDFSFCDVKDENLFKVCACDPAGLGQDSTGIVVLGADHKMNIYVLAVVNRHLQPSEIIDMIFRLQRKYNFKKFGIETNFFRGTLKSSLEHRLRDAMADNSIVPFSIEEFKHGSGDNKIARIRGLQPYFEQHKIFFPGKKFETLKAEFAILADQLIRFPRSQHDDAADAMAMCMSLLSKGGVAVKQDPPKNTPAWIELDNHRKNMEQNIGIPRRLRKRIEADFAFN